MTGIMFSSPAPPSFFINIVYYKAVAPEKNLSNSLKKGR